MSKKDKGKKSFKDENKKKKEEKKEEEKKIEEEEKKEEEIPKKEEKKEEDNKDEAESQPKVETIPREPEKKIPTDFTGDIELITSLKNEGNSAIKNDLESALKKYEEANEKLIPVMKQADKEREYNAQVDSLLKLEKQVMNNLALAYWKSKEYEKAINIDIKIIAKDPLFDKSYSRLFSCHKEKGDLDGANYFGQMLKKNFTEETKNKYADLMKEIDEVEGELNKKYSEMARKRRKEMITSIAKYAIPLVVLGAAVALYFFVFRKKLIKKK